MQKESIAMKTCYKETQAQKYFWKIIVGNDHSSMLQQNALDRLRFLESDPEQVSEAAIQRYSYKRMFWKYAANLLEKTHAEVRFQ